MANDQEESTESPRLRTANSRRDGIPRSLSAADGNNTSKNPDCMNDIQFAHGYNSFLPYNYYFSGEMEIQRMSSRTNKNGLSRNEDSSLESANGIAPKKGMILPFTPLAMSFDDVKYYVDMPAVRINGPCLIFFFPMTQNLCL